MSSGPDEAAVRLAVQEASAHPAVSEVVVTTSEDATVLDFKLDLGFGSRWLAAGESPSGVWPAEPVRFGFSGAFPRKAPSVTLRPDFRRDHPHVQPWLEDGRVVPCLVDGRVSEFVAARGICALVEQLRAWLLKAADGRLMNLEQGWEPTRRDDVTDWLEASGDMLRGLADPKGGFALLETTYLHKDDAAFTSFYGPLGDRTTAQTTFSTRASKNGDLRYGSGLAVVVWPGSNPGKQPKVCADYLPETVTDVQSLWARAQQLGLGQELRNAVDLLGTTRRDRAPAVYPLPIVLLIRRPARVIGSESDIEITPYLARFTMPQPLLSQPEDPVRPMAHLEERSQSLFRRLARVAQPGPWALLGCGSLGSKIALHAARAGAAPALVADPSRMSPHNAARHGLYPAGEGRADWVGPKAELLAATCRGLSAATQAVEGDQRLLGSAIAAIPKKADRPRLVLNTTASLVAREDLCGAGRPTGARVVDATLYGGGAMAVVAAEDGTLNPDVCELQGQLFARAAEAPEMSPLFGEALDRVSIGQGCGSLTMRMSDARLSVMAALIADDLCGGGEEQFPAGLRVFLREGSGVRSIEVATTPCVRVPLEGLDGWSISVSERLAARIDAERAAYDPVETGGVLLGWTSTIARRIYVVGLLEAPSDSLRSREEFVLGVDGLTGKLEDLARRTGGALGCVGTWHCHSGSASPSGRDRSSAAAIGAVEPRPMALLIRGRVDWRALSAAPPKWLRLTQ